MPVLCRKRNGQSASLVDWHSLANRQKLHGVLRTNALFAEAARPLSFLDMSSDGVVFREEVGYFSCDNDVSM
jgi:hypothetical protein